MQPEDIIQAKEWSQLTDDEKAFIAPLASNRGEYNVLKKMLLIAAEEAAGFPRMNGNIRLQLHKHLPKPIQAKRRTVWWTAAAVLAALLATGLFLLPKKEPMDTAATPAQTPGQQKRSDAPVQQPPLPNLPVLPQLPVAKANTAKRIKTKAPLPGKGRDEPQDVAQLNTSVGGNADLLAFVTEVY